MANIRLDMNRAVVDGETLTFRSPANCSDITGLKVYYPQGSSTTSRVFAFADAHGNNVGSIDLFAANVLVKVVMDTQLNRAYVQNADTNGYLERKFPGRTTETGGAVFGDHETNQATAQFASAHGTGTVAKNEAQHVVGKFNAHENGEIDNALFVVGNGTSDSARSNAFVINKDGSIILGDGAFGDTFPDNPVKNQLFFLKV